MTVAIIDYGSGNLHSAAKAFERAVREAGMKCEVKVTSRPEDVRAAEHVVLPGVGAFAECRRGLDRLPGMVEALEEAVGKEGKPFLGICVGAQLLATRGLEHEVVAGLGWIAGDVAPIKPCDPALKIPHMGWNTLDVKRAHPVLAGVRTGPDGLQRLFCPFLSALSGGPGGRRRNRRVRRSGDRDRCEGHDRRDAVPPGEEPDARPPAHRQFPQVAPVILFPAIDLKNGECVRLLRGDMTKATVFNADPAAQARIFAEQGFDYLHVVDLDGAFAGRPVNAEAVKRILSGLTMKTQLGGGVRDMKTVRGWLESGVTRVIIGTAAVSDPDFVREAARVYPGRIAVGVDARDGRVAVEGWAKSSDVSALDLGRRFEDAGVAAIIYTDIARDGALAGLNIAGTVALADALSIPVIASGGLASIDDIKRLTEPDCARIGGAIAGRALYDGRLDPREALAWLRGHGVGSGRAEAAIP